MKTKSVMVCLCFKCPEIKLVRPGKASVDALRVAARFVGTGFAEEAYNLVLDSAKFERQLMDMVK